jgi:hypothetical protein
VILAQKDKYIHGLKQNGKKWDGMKEFRNRHLKINLKEIILFIFFILNVLLYFLL